MNTTQNTTNQSVSTKVDAIIGSNFAIEVTPKQLENLLLPITKSTTCHVVYLVDDRRSKTVKGEKQVQKLSQITHVYLNHDYTNKVQNLTGQDFVAEDLEKYGKTRISTTIIEAIKTGNRMIDGKVLNGNTAKIVAHYHNGQEITEAGAMAEDLWAPSYYKPSEKKTKGRGLVSKEKDFDIINTYLSRMEAIKIDKQWYKVVK